METQIWGNHWRSTWCYTRADAVSEAIASNSRGPVQEVMHNQAIYWLLLTLHVPLSKLPTLMYREYITTGVERSHIISLRVHGDLAGELIHAVDWIE